VETEEEERPMGSAEILQRDMEAHIWMHRLIQGEIAFEELHSALSLEEKTLQRLYQWALTKRVKYRNRAVTILAHFSAISQSAIARFLGIKRLSVHSYIERFNTDGIKGLMDRDRVDVKKYERQDYKDAVFKVLHTPPSAYDINRTTWRLEDLQRILKQEGFSICKPYIEQITKDAGYKFLKAKFSLTSNDPQFREKLQKITNILSNLQPNEKFFSIDEFGPCAIKMCGGRSLMLPTERKTIPQYQKSKGSLIVTAALELSTNQVTHFYSPAKNTTEMIKLLEVLLEEYSNEECIYFSWDAASWHASKALYNKVDEVNSIEYRGLHHNPKVELAPLPSNAQFLNVIESVFSGMAKAIIHNSDYASVEEAKAAIDRYFAERNQAFKEHPKRAGKKIWGKERTKAEFSEGNNCKDPRYCRKR
jgi:transposase